MHLVYKYCDICITLNTAVSNCVHECARACACVCVCLHVITKSLLVFNP